MPERVQISLEGVSETLLMTLYVRARETQRPDAMIRDEKAVEMVGQIKTDFSRFRLQRHDEIAILLRMSKFDSCVRDFLKRCPNAVVVHIGCGLDTRFERVDNGVVEWFDLDMPDVMALREKFIPIARSRCHPLATSVFEEGWLGEVSRFKPRSFMFIAEGVLPYFEEAQVKALLLNLGKHFPGCEVVTDAHTPFVIWADNIHLALVKVMARMHWSIKNGREVEGWGEDFRLLDEWNYYQEDAAQLKAFRWVRLIPPLAKSSGVFHYRLGIQK